MEDPNLWRDNPSDRAYAEGYRKGLEKGYRKGLEKGYRKGYEDAQKEIKYMTEINVGLESIIKRAVKSIECPCAGCKRTESDYCGLRAYCEEFRKWKEADDVIHSEGET